VTKANSVKLSFCFEFVTLVNSNKYLHYDPAESIFKNIYKPDMNCGVMAAGLCEVVERSPRGDGKKGRVHPCTSTEVLYRPYGPYGE
jgi:hypothetical protein